MSNPIQVWLYRGWYWSCWYQREFRDVPCAVGYDFPSPGQAADDARRHFQTHVRDRQPA